ncbi:hypothetical protein GIB67_037692 [Kingdonia uniflora]|uniref:Uncharacterized protein n=1 Tax=Kingdonia uniflora TaxID=39325 RepID=A0A7J7MGY7_9MAGN|nr:hypothetical protein GIB67_037692 [Kingdonia uniflora]
MIISMASPVYQPSLNLPLLLHIISLLLQFPLFQNMKILHAIQLFFHCLPSYSSWSNGHSL